MYKLFGISNCDTVKKARNFLDKKNILLEFVDFKKYQPSTEDIQRWSMVFGGLPVNTKGITYKKHKTEFEKLTLKAQIQFIQKNTSMIKRPILEKNNQVLAFGFDEQSYLEVL